MRTLRTPESRFTSLDFLPARYADVPDPDGGSLRMAYVEEGSGPVVLLLHGEPTWSYLYRSMIGPIAAGGFRVVAPDMIGFGRSDKPAEVADHTYARHLDWTRAFLDALDLRDVTLFCQDWGGLLGLRLVAEQPERFARVVASNTGIPTGDRPMPPAWQAFREMVQTAPALDVGRMVASGCRRGLSDEARAAYDAPFPDPAYQAGPRAMPGLVPNAPDDPQAGRSREAWVALARFERPFLTAFSDGDPITAGADRPLRAAIPGAVEPEVVTGAGHFVQEDAGEQLARIVVRFATRPA